MHVSLCPPLTLVGGASTMMERGTLLPAFKEDGRNEEAKEKKKKCSLTSHAVRRGSPALPPLLWSAHITLGLGMFEQDCVPLLPSGQAC